MCYYFVTMTIYHGIMSGAADYLRAPRIDFSCISCGYRTSPSNISSETALESISGSPKFKGRGTWKICEFSLPKSCSLRPLVSVGFSFSERFHCQRGTCKIDILPVLLRPARRILLRSIWGTALRDIVKGVIAEHTYSIYVERLPYNSCLHRLES